jgi:hypothetical protein
VIEGKICDFCRNHMSQTHVSEQHLELGVF